MPLRGDQRGADQTGQSAVLLPVPEAEPLLGPWREKGDPSAARGVPAHVTLLYPFLPVDRIDAGVEAELEWFFAGVDAFDVVYTAVGQFPAEGVVHLVPDSRLLTELTRAFAMRWPECPPYGGKHPEPVPHLTVVHTGDAPLRAAAARGVEPGLPLRTSAVRAALWTCDDGTWSERAGFDLGPAEP